MSGEEKSLRKQITHGVIYCSFFSNASLRAVRFLVGYEWKSLQTFEMRQLHVLCDHIAELQTLNRFFLPDFMDAPETHISVKAGMTYIVTVVGCEGQQGLLCRPKHTQKSVFILVCKYDFSS